MLDLFHRYGYMTPPRRIFSYWHQGFGDAPPLVQLCIMSMRRHHPSWEINLLDPKSIEVWLKQIPIPEKKWCRLPIAHRADVIRTQLLLRHGGVWADPTVWFADPIDEWLSVRMDSGFFMFHRPGRDRLISNWFIAAEAGNPLLARFYEELCRYWRENDFETIGFTERRKVNLLSRALHRNLRLPQIWFSKPMIRLFHHAPYMVYHYLFARMVRTDSACAAVWDATPRETADAPHRLLRHGLLARLTPEVKQALQVADPPLFKLTWKLGDARIPDNSVLAELFRREGLALPAESRPGVVETS
mgnify:CR=1 FL=1